jgi:hypothetical protein
MRTFHVALTGAAALGCVTSISVDQAAAQTAEEAARRARIIASAAVGRAAVAQCDYDKWAAARTEYGDAAGISPWNPRPAAGGGLPPFPSYPVPCSPQTAVGPPASTAPVTSTGFYIGPSVSTTYGISVSNGGLGGKQTVTSPGVDLGVTTPRFQTRAYGSHGSSEKSFSAQGGTYGQPTGGTQPTAAAGVGQHTFEARFTQFGAGFFYLPSPGPARVERTFQFMPFVGFGIERTSLKTTQSGRWSQINFTNLDIRETQVTSPNVSAGAQLNVANMTGAELFVRFFATLNLDLVEGTGFFNTAQTGLFNASVMGWARSTTLTYAGQFDAGGATTLRNGVRVELSGSVRYFPLWEVEYHNGLPMTVEEDYKWGWGITGRVSVPLAPPAPPEPRWRF